MISDRIKYNANKFVYLALAYPEKQVPQLLGLFRLSPIDMNCAIWYALNEKWIEIEERIETIEEIDKKGKPTGKTREVPVQYVKVDAEIIHGWDFGPEEAELEQTILYAFEKIAVREEDLEENYLANWLSGYTPQDTLIAIKHLLEIGQLHEYEIEDSDSSYIFYTLKANKGKNWGAKQFKINPLTGEENKVEAEKAGADKPTE